MTKEWVDGDGIRRASLELRGKSLSQLEIIADDLEVSIGEALRQAIEDAFRRRRPDLSEGVALGKLIGGNDA